MNFFLSDRIKETSRSIGTGNFLLDGEALGFSSFSDYYTYGDYFYYAITDGTDYEVGSGEYILDGSNDAIRRWPLQSTNSNNYVNFNAGTKEVFVTYAAAGAVYSASGVDGRPEPESSGIVFWGSDQIVEYNDKLIWDNDNYKLGVYQQNPITAIEVGGSIDYSVIRASGFMDGGSGVLFSGVAGSFSGGRQLEPFLRTQVNNETGSDAIIELSGLVSESVLLVKQAPRLFFAGPENDCGCVNDYPTFRLIDIDDLPLSDLDFRYLRQSNVGIAPSNDNISPRNYEAGMVSLYKASGEITYDSGIYYSSLDKSLAIGKNAAIDGWRETLDVQGSAIFDGDITAEDLNVRNITANDLTVRDVTGRNFVGASGTFEHIIFTNDTARLSEFSLTNSFDVGFAIGLGEQTMHNASGAMQTIAIGHKAAKLLQDGNASIIMGYLSGEEASGVNRTVAIGANALRSVDIANDLVVIGSGAAESARNILKTVAVGTDSLNQAIIIQDTVMVGSSAGAEASGVRKTVAIGDSSVREGKNLNHSVYVGLDAGKNSIDSFKVVAVGSGAAVASSGSYNVFIGPEAGASVSGWNNIEIISSGRGMLPSPDVSGKLNIGNFLIGDMNQGRIAVGWASGLEPGATLHLLPSGHKDPVILVDQQKEPGMIPLNDYGDLLKFRRYGVGDGDTIYHITQAGNTIASGYMAPAEGLLLESNVPTPITNRLYNDMGTLKFNGAALAVGGSFSEFFVADGTQPKDDVTTGQTVMWSGISGINVQYRDDEMLFNISAGELSGVFQSAVDDATYDLFMAASGLGDSDGRNRTVADQDYIIVSGVSGIKVDLADYSGTGVWILGWDGTQTYSFNMTDGVVPADSISDASTVTITGVSGVRVDYTAADNTFRVSDDIASGVVTAQINAVSGLTNSVSGLFDYWLSNEWGLISVSGISGIAYYASGQVDNITAPTFAEYGSGIAKTDNIVRLDPDGSGLLKRLGMNDYQAVIIGASGCQAAIGYQSGVFMGYKTGLESWKTEKSVVIGALAGFQSSGNRNIVAIGSKSNYQTPDSSGSVMIGHDSSSQSSGNICSVIIGGKAAVGTSGNNRLISIGCDSASQLRTSDGVIAIGRGVADSGYNFSNTLILGNNAAGYTFGRDLTWTEGFIAIGNRSLQSASGTMENSINIGTQSSRNSQFIASGIHIGPSANNNSRYNYTNIMIGNQAGFESQRNTDSVFMGDTAGVSSSGLVDCVYIGTNAGLNASGLNPGTRSKFNVAIGYGSGRESKNNERTITIGYNAGGELEGVKSSTYIGDYAGHGRQNRERELIITSRASLSTIAKPPSNDAQSGYFTDEDGMVSIQDCIQGIVDDDLSTADGGTSPIIKLHLGSTLGLDSSDTSKAEQDKLNRSVVTITPSRETQAAIKLYQHDQRGGDWEQEAGTQDTPLLLTQGGRTDISSRPGEFQLINPQGMLCMAHTQTPNGINNYGIARQNATALAPKPIEYYNGSTYTITPSPGAIIPCTNAGKTAAGIAVYWNGFWWFIEGTAI